MPTGNPVTAFRLQTLEGRILHLQRLVVKEGCEQVKGIALFGVLHSLVFTLSGTCIRATLRYFSFSHVVWGQKEAFQHGGSWVQNLKARSPSQPKARIESWRVESETDKT